MDEFEVISKNKTDFVSGNRGSSLLLYQNQLYNKSNAPYYNCRNKECRISIRFDPSKSNDVEPRNPKQGHLEVCKCEVDCLWAIRQMKDEASSTNLNEDICTIYNDGITYLTILVSLSQVILNLGVHWISVVKKLNQNYRKLKMNYIYLATIFLQMK